MAIKSLTLACILLLAVASALAQPGRPGGGPPGGQGGQGGPRGGPGGPGRPGGERRGPPLNLTVVGNMTGDVGARLANCSADQTVLDGHFYLAIFKNSSGNYNLLLDAHLDASCGPPDSLAIVQGTVCDAAAMTVLSLLVAASKWQQRAGWWLLHLEAAFLENADASTVDALLAILPNATLPRQNGTGRGGGNGAGAREGSAGGASSSEQGGRRMGAAMHAVVFSKQVGKKQGGQQQGGVQQGGQQQGGAQQQQPAGAPSGGFLGG